MKNSGIGLPTQPEIVLPTVPGQANLRLDRLSGDDEAGKRSEKVPEACVEEVRIGKGSAEEATLKETRAKEAREGKARVGEDRLGDGVHTALHEVNRMVVCARSCVRACVRACVRSCVCACVCVLGGHISLHLCKHRKEMMTMRALNTSDA